MTLPFDIPDRNKRKYQCFVCGKLYEDFIEYKDHIIENHEEGREYVVCPLERCQAPVRDMKMHFKARHPSEDFRRVTGPTRALIWKDFSPRGKGKTRKPKFRSGKHTSTKTGRVLQYRSGMEKQVFELLDQDKEVVDYQAEPFEIDYTHQGKLHKYIPEHDNLHHLSDHLRLGIFLLSGRANLSDYRSDHI